MDSIRYMLGAIVKIVVVLLIVAFLMVVFRYAYPGGIQVSFSGLAIKGDWLPAPRDMKKEAPKPGADGYYGTVYQHGAPFGGYQAQPQQYITYSSQGQQANGTVQPYAGGSSPSAERAYYVRNLSVYEGAPVSHGMALYGESRDSMFKNGIFQIVIADRSGKAIVSMPAINLGTWSVPGWARWKAVVPIKLPQNIDCLLVFVSGDGRAVTSFPVRCN